MKILIVDERQPVRAALHFYIKFNHPNWVIFEAETLTDMCHKLEAGCVDLILLDWEMNPQNKEKNPLPHVTWSEILRAVCRRCPSIKIVVMSSDQQVEKEALDAGAHYFLDKTSSPDRVFQLLTVFHQQEPER